MDNQMKLVLVGVCIFNLSACGMMSDNLNPNYQAYTYYSNPFYGHDDYNVIDYNYRNQAKEEVIIPDSYHVGDLSSPVSFKDRDQAWVSSQNPQEYTIQLAEGDKASKVAGVLYKAPKNDRMAQVKYERGGKEYYRGVYGTYASPQEAQKALNALPPDIKNGASVKNWSSIQAN